MATINNWHQGGARRSKPKRVRLTSVGLSFNHPGEKPQELLLMLKDDEKELILNLDLNKDEVERLAQTVNDYLSRYK